MELGEEPEDAAVRELLEETGIQGTIDRLLGVTSNPSDQYHTVLMVGYLVTSFTGEPRAGDDAEEIGWFEMNALPEVAFRSHRRFIETYYRVELFPDFPAAGPFAESNESPPCPSHRHADPADSLAE